MSLSLLCFPALPEASQALAERVCQRAARHKGVFALALPGGSTPATFLRLLAASDLDWKRVIAFPADERWVAPDAADSNEGLIRRCFSDNPAAVLAVRSLYSPVLSPAGHATALDRSMPPADMVILGMGEDGHVASLFPGYSLALPHPGSRFGWLEQNPKDQHRRMTLTERALIEAPVLALLLQGGAKAALIDRVLAGKEPELPVSLITRRQGETVIFEAP